VILRRRALTSGFVPPVSLVLGANAKAYVRGLEAFREGHVAEWCALFAAAVRTAGDEANRFGAAIDRLRATWREAAGHPRAGSTAERLIEALPGFPILEAATVETFAKVSHQAARLALISLERAGVIKRINVGKRNRAWEAVGLFEAVDAGEDAARRRRRA
jgi:Fic family protein